MTKSSYHTIATLCIVGEKNWDTKEDKGKFTKKGCLEGKKQ